MEQKRFIDLHTHTTESDGSMTPVELVRYAHAKGLAAVAITDHDTIGGLDDAAKEGRRLGIEVIAGVEISVDFSQWFNRIKSINSSIKTDDGPFSRSPEMHILGYFFDGQYGPILKTLDDMRIKRRERNDKIARALKELGFDINIDEVNSMAVGGNAGRSHFARLMVQKGYVKSTAEAFDKYLSYGKPAYYKKEKLSPEEGIWEIVNAKGIASLAHPRYLNLNEEEMDTVTGWLAAAGLKGIEAYYSENTEEETSYFLKLAEKYKLVATGGSDFHGSFKDGIDIGVGRGTLMVPYSALESLKEAFPAT